MGEVEGPTFGMCATVLGLCPLESGQLSRRGILTGLAVVAGV